LSFLILSTIEDQLVIFVVAPTPFVDVDRRLLSQTNDAHMLTSNNAMSTASEFEAALTAFLLRAVHRFFPLSKCFTFIYLCEWKNTVQKKCQPTVAFTHHINSFLANN
ncbi:putative EH domain-containing protein 3, partial [Trichinella spiralis]|uniref:putative EH domain-containing protein 3 n=1 Tax=Trichinella spiralis TaxID=6334 RepID=UPI0001EFE93D